MSHDTKSVGMDAVVRWMCNVQYISKPERAMLNIFIWIYFRLVARCLFYWMVMIKLSKSMIYDTFMLIKKFAQYMKNNYNQTETEKISYPQILFETIDELLTWG